MSVKRSRCEAAFFFSKKFKKTLDMLKIISIFAVY